MKSINTEYNGYFFRSRMEARWAVFFDAISVKYHYEHQDFILKSGRYLPDFYLPTFNGGAFAEVKPKFEADAIEKCRQLCELTKQDVLMLEDVPDFKCVRYFWWNTLFSDIPKVQQSVGLICADQASGENRMFVEPGYENDDLTISEENISMLGEIFIEAVFASRSARFEFLDKV